MSVQAEAGFQPQAVAGAEPDRQDGIMVEQGAGQRFGLVRRHRDLVTVFAGIAGARDETGDSHHGLRAGVHEAQRGGGRRELRQHIGGLRSLQRDQRAVAQRFDLAGLREMFAQMRLVVALAGGVDHQEQMIAEIGHHQIVENAAAVVGELRITLAVGRDPDDVLRHQPLQRARRILESAGFRTQPELAHVGDVKQAGGGAGVQMFPEHAGAVLHRHLVACERHHLAATRDMQRVKRGPFQGRIEGSLCVRRLCVGRFGVGRHLADSGRRSRTHSSKTRRSPICRCA